MRIAGLLIAIVQLRIATFQNVFTFMKFAGNPLPTLFADACVLIACRRQLACGRLCIAFLAPVVLIRDAFVFLVHFETYIG